jgi:integrase
MRRSYSEGSNNMGRPRKPSNTDLPPGMTRRTMKSGAVHYYAAAAGGKKIPLGTDLCEARVKWAELKRSDDAAPADLFSAVCKKYEETELLKKSPKTQREYGYSIARLNAAFDGARLRQIQPKHVREYLDMRSAKVSANRDIACFSAIWNYARESGITALQNPTQGVSRHEETPRSNVVNRREFASVWWYAEPALRDMLDIALLTGQREADILKLRITDIADGRLHVKQNKTGAKIAINISGRLAWIIKRARSRKRSASGAYLIQTDKGQRFTYAMFRKRFDAARKAAGAVWEFRDLRATSATELDDLRHAQRLLGHRSETTTANIYRRLVGDVVDPLPK